MAMPNILYVKIEQDGDVSYPVADENIEKLIEMGEKTQIGVYTLSYLEDVQGVIKRTSREWLS